MTMQAHPAAGPERLDVQVYRRTRVTLRGERQAAGADPVLVLESADVALLALLAQGLAPVSVGRRMGLTERTIRRRLVRLCDRLGVATPMQAVVWAVRHGVI